MIKVFDIKYHNLNLKEERFIIFNKDDEYYYLLDDNEKINDVNLMPHYIRDDYYHYNSKVLTLGVFNKIIEKYKIKYTLKPHFLGNKLETSINQFSDKEEEVIKVIKRDLSLKEIL